MNRLKELIQQSFGLFHLWRRKTFRETPIHRSEHGARLSTFMLTAHELRQARRCAQLPIKRLLVARGAHRPVEQVRNDRRVFRGADANGDTGQERLRKRNVDLRLLIAQAEGAYIMEDADNLPINR